MSEFRKDPVFNNWSVIDSGKVVNSTLLHFEEEDILEYSEKCPFCPGNEGVTGKELLRYNFISKEKGSWDIRVFPSKTPVVKVETVLDKVAEGIYDWVSGVGAYEVIVESPVHNHKYNSMSLNRIEQILWAYHDRVWDLKKDSRLEYILFFKEFKISGSLKITHPFSQLLAVPFVPPLVEEEIRNAASYFKAKERCVFCDIVKNEIKSGVRIVAMNDKFVAVCPYASRKPFEVWILPISHNSHFEKASKTDYYSFAEIFSICSKKLKSVVGCSDFGFVLHNSPLKSEDIPYYHWHMEIYPDIIPQSVMHIGSCMHINPVSPEDAAKALREEKF